MLAIPTAVGTIYNEYRHPVVDMALNRQIQLYHLHKGIQKGTPAFKCDVITIRGLQLITGVTVQVSATDNSHYWVYCTLWQHIALHYHKHTLNPVQRLFLG